MAINTIPNICPTTCTDGVLFPATAADPTCSSFAVFDSQIDGLYIRGKTAAPASAFSDDPFLWADIANSVPANIDNTLTDNTKAKFLMGEGGVAVPEKTTIEVHSLKNITTKRRYQLTYLIKDMSDANYDLCRAFQCGDTNIKFYYTDLGGKVYGIDGGLEPVFVDCDMPKDAARGAINQATIIIEWEAKYDPERKDNPYA